MSNVLPLFSWSTDDRSNRSRVLALLQDGKPHTTLELQAVGGTRAPARVFELRRLGHRIDCTGERGRYVYKWHGQEAPEPKPQRATWKERALRAEQRLRDLGVTLEGANETAVAAD